MKNVVIISSSPRRNGNSETLAKKFREGACDAGHNVKFFNLNDYKINYCQSCWFCKKNNKCQQEDDFNGLVDNLRTADVVLFATPTYFYNVSGQLKVFIDRCCCICESFHFDTYFVMTANDSNPQLLEHVVNCFRGFSKECLENCPEKGVIKAGDDDVEPYLNRAYQMGKNC